MPPSAGSRRPARRRSLWLGLFAFGVLWMQCGPPWAGLRKADDTGSATGFQWQLPPTFPEPVVPSDNPMSAAKVELGRHLFYDARLSKTGDFSCATCHRQALAFTDGQARAVGATGEVHRRSAMSLTNVAYNRHLTWADPQLESLERQLLTPLFGRHPLEMGLEQGPPQGPQILHRLASDRTLRHLFETAFVDDPRPVNFENLGRALAAFQRTLLSGDSPFDRYWHQGQDDALNATEKRGMALFFSRRLACSTCHSGFNLSGPVVYRGHRPPPQWHNTGLYNLSAGAYPSIDQGLFELTHKPSDMGRFRAPTLRNIAVTAPYMHDGSIATLQGVLDHYAVGGRSIRHGALVSDGAKSPWKSEQLRGFSLSPQEQHALIAFLNSLTDPSFLENPRFGPP